MRERTLRSEPAAAPDRTARLLEVGLVGLIFLAPLPFGAVAPEGRLALEIGAMLLLVIWIARAGFHPTPLPSRLVLTGIAGLLGLALLQAIPLGSPIVSRFSPRAVEIRQDSRTPAVSEPAESEILGRDVAELEPTATLSLDPGATASALRTGAALAALLLVATTVASVCGARRLALGLLLSAAFQGLYGVMVVASGHDRIWHLPKEYFLDSATGTFVNKNHFAGLLAMSLAGGMALIYRSFRVSRQASRDGSPLAALFRPDGIRSLLLCLPLVIGLAGLMLSYSRAGIALGLLALGVTILAAGRFQRLRTRLIVGVSIVAAAAVPIVRLGWERLAERYAASATELVSARVTVITDSFSLIGDFPVTGCGFGSFYAAYPLVRSPEVRSFYSHVHNDFLQVWVEGGAIGLTFLLLLLIPLLHRTLRAIGGAKGTIAIGLAAGLMALLLHSMVDFSLHIPSNAAIAAILAGALQGLPWKRQD